MKTPYSEFFWSVFSRIRTEYGDLLIKSPYSVRMRENADQENSGYRLFLRTSNPDKLVFAHLDINSIRNKFEMISDQIKGNVDVYLVSETKTDDSFPNGNFLIDRFSTLYRLDRNSDGGGLCYLSEKIFLQT